VAHLPSKIKRHHRTLQEGKLNLTPMVDIFVCLLVFLLQSYSASQQVVTSDDYFQLPVSDARQEPHIAVTIKVNRDVVVLDDEVILDTHDAIRQEDLLLEPLYRSLAKKADRTRFISSQNATVKFKGDVIIQGDREIPFMLLKKIMYTCSRAEFGNIALAVLQKAT
jgi:biopolymer transport protein ExbD